MAALKLLFAGWLLLNGILIAELLIRFDYRTAWQRMLRLMAGYMGQPQRLPIRIPTRKADARAKSGASLTMARTLSAD
jgi:hypothetical protein